MPCCQDLVLQRIGEFYLASADVARQNRARQRRILEQLRIMILADSFGYFRLTLGSGATVLGSVMAADPSFIKQLPATLRLRVKSEE